ncbi:MAG: hypothetical protein AM326_06510 [Candidatus Thorarchaeota archaeon SMTZ-45]|nr:MAG: hypothetical protein AM325_14390 [Candidatus Thorarchaeota archaeon SMTZ1-45]KXH76827.1 MAG: hypothetical protein AM326_06510 [Candidatus Thorarchaeota archaeon SMTZ-45]
MKKALSNLVMGVLIILLLSTVSISHTPEVVEYSVERTSSPILAGIVWSENFDDEDFSDWMIFEINWTLPDGVVNFTIDPADLYNVSDGVLRAIGPEWNFAMRENSVAYGTWSFDIDIQRPDDINRFGVGLTGENYSDHWLPPTGSSNAYLISILIPNEGPSGDIRLARNEYPGTTNIVASYYVENIRGWKNFIVTREFDREGYFHIYMDGILIISAVDTYHTTSEYFTVFGMANHAIDNITVSDTIDYDAAPPDWEPKIPNLQITEGESFYYDANATDFSGIDKWWIDDTENFTIDEDGVITSTHNLAVGEYITTVWVNDTLGYMSGDAFSLIVNPATPTTTSPPTTPTPTPVDGPIPPIPMELIVAVTGVAVVVILVLVIWRIRK